MSPTRSGSERSRWLAAIVLALLLHAGLLLLLSWLEPFRPTPVQASEPRPIELVFTPAPSATPASPDEPRFFSELPEDRADVRPERAELLSNVDSRARDRREGGEDGGLPQLQGEADAPHVRMQDASSAEAAEEIARGLLEGQGAAEPEQAGRNPQEGPAEMALPEAEAQELEDAGPSPEGERVRSEEPVGGERAADGPLARPGDPRRELLRGEREPSEGRLELLRRTGNSDIFQEEMANPGGNVALFGDVSLNTLAWDWAPWLQRFRRDFLRNWYAPYAYHLGLIHGEDVVELEVAPDGRMIRLDLLEEVGHESLAQASLAALRATAPFQPLPKDFPEPSLVLRIRLVYQPR